MRRVVFGTRFLIVIATSFLVLAAPKTPGWQFVAGFFYPIGVLVLLALLDDDLDIVDLALHGMTGPEGSPLTPKSLLGRAVALFAFWFVVVALGLLLSVFPMDHVHASPHDLEGSAAMPYFLAGTLVGAVIYLAAVGWYRKSMRRRYGY